MPNIFLALPHTGNFCANALVGIAQPSMQRDPDNEFLPRHRIFLRQSAIGLATLNFNTLWCMALNMRKESGLTHFAMMHSDVVAPAGWLDVMLGEMDAVGADVLSAVIPIKDNRGLTSTGMRLRDGGVRRLTLREVHHELPPTFSIRDIGDNWKGSQTTCLAVNTGLWVCDFTKSWVERISECSGGNTVTGFTVTDEIKQTPDGKFYAHCEPEDWRFSRWCAVQRLKVFATSKVALSHEGRMEFTNGDWGDWKTDLGDG